MDREKTFSQEHCEKCTRVVLGRGRVVVRCAVPDPGDKELFFPQLDVVCDGQPIVSEHNALLLHESGIERQSLSMRRWIGLALLGARAKTTQTRRPMPSLGAVRARRA
jgi:hypothetical protein